VDTVLDDVKVTDDVAEAVSVADVVGVGDTEVDVVDDSVMEAVGEVVGQFCCSFMLSSPMGPSSIEPRLALMAIHATTGSQGVITEPVASLRARAAGIREYPLTTNSKWGAPGAGPT
jgi:hypothetical protein